MKAQYLYSIAAHSKACSRWKTKTYYFGSSQTRAVLSSLAVTTRLPSGLKLALPTAASWRIGSPSGLPVAASHSRAVLSSLAVTMREPPGLKLALLSDLSWRIGSPSGLPVAASHSHAVLSSLAVTMRE